MTTTDDEQFGVCPFLLLALIDSLLHVFVHSTNGVNLKSSISSPMPKEEIYKRGSVRCAYDFRRTIDAERLETCPFKLESQCLWLDNNCFDSYEKMIFIKANREFLRVENLIRLFEIEP